MDLTMEERVAAGANLLDELMPGWHRDVDLNSLQMMCMNACIIGQVFNCRDGYESMEDYDAALEFLGIPNHADEYGFDDKFDGDYGRLASHWSVAVEIRKSD